MRIIFPATAFTNQICLFSSSTIIFKVLKKKSTELLSYKFITRFAFVFSNIFSYNSAIISSWAQIFWRISSSINPSKSNCLFSISDVGGSRLSFLNIVSKSSLCFWESLANVRSNFLWEEPIVVKSFHVETDSNFFSISQSFYELDT